MVFCVKYRRGLLILDERCEYLKQVLKEIGERYWLEIEEMGTDGDHIHLKKAAHTPQLAAIGISSPPTVGRQYNWEYESATGESLRVSNSVSHGVLYQVPSGSAGIRRTV